MKKLFLLIPVFLLTAQVSVAGYPAADHRRESVVAGALRTQYAD